MGMPMPCSSSDSNVEASVADKDCHLVNGVVAPATSRIFRSEGYTGDDESPAEGNKTLTPLPPEEVEGILSLKPLRLIPGDDRETLVKLFPTYSPEQIDEIMEIERRGYEASVAIDKDFSAFKDWVRKEQEEHGVVMVDDGFLAHREQTRELLRKEFNELFDSLEDDVSVVGSYSELYGTDDDDEEDQDQDQEGGLGDDLFVTASKPEVDYVSKVKEDNESEKEFNRLENESSDSEFDKYSDTYTEEDEEDDEEVALESTSTSH